MHPPIFISTLPPSSPSLPPPFPFLQAKIADFGFFKTMDDNKGGSMGAAGRREAQSTRVLGTPGYVDPEYYFTCKVTTKSDVYRCVHSGMLEALGLYRWGGLNVGRV